MPLPRAPKREIGPATTGTPCNSKRAMTASGANVVANARSARPISFSGGGQHRPSLPGQGPWTLICCEPMRYEQASSGLPAASGLDSGHAQHLEVEVMRRLPVVDVDDDVIEILEHRKILSLDARWPCPKSLAPDSSAAPSRPSTEAANSGPPRPKRSRARPEPPSACDAS